MKIVYVISKDDADCILALLDDIVYRLKKENPNHYHISHALYSAEEIIKILTEETDG